VFFQNKITNKKSVVAQGGGTIQDFDVFALDHDSDRHFSYLNTLEINTMPQNYPFIDSRVQISRLEIWVTINKTRVNTTSNLRNIIALQDLGKANYLGFLIMKW
jgi:cell surface protein SprA